MSPVANLDWSSSKLKVRGYIVKFFFRSSVAIALACIGAEFGARLDDVVRSGVSLFATPRLESDLQSNRDGKIVGKPFGVYMATQLNSHGFRGPELQVPLGNRRRVLLIGASETFGSPSRIDDQYASYLQDELPSCEVVNASIVGQNAASLLGLWEGHLKQLEPDTVVIYCNPYFYARVSNDGQPTKQKAIVENASATARFQSRFVSKFKSSISIPLPIQRWRQLAVLRKEIQKLPNAKQLEAIPTTADEAFLSDLKDLVNSVSIQVENVLLITHPISARTHANGDSRVDDHLLNFQLIRPQFSQAAIVEFSHRIRESMLSMIWLDNVTIVDLAGRLGGRKVFFRDLVHFNERGAREVAKDMAAAIEKRR